MSKPIFGALALAGMLAFSTASVSAQEAPSEADLTLHPGDTITWTTNRPHRVKFGGAGVTPFADIQAILEDFTPDVTESGGVALGPEAPAGGTVTLTAKVRADAAVDAEFNFTCGFTPHTAVMITKPFKISAADGAPARDIQIESSTSGAPRWILKGRDKKLSGP